jgi:RND family efflux transporter MFP subunit
LLAIVLLGLAGCRPAAKEGDPPTDDEAAALKVQVQPVVRTSLDETVEVLGVTGPLRSKTARITTAVEGRVADILPENTEAAVREHDDGSGDRANATTHNTLARPLAAAEDDAGRSPPQPAVEGQIVSKRQVIVRLDDSLARAAVAKVEGALAEAQAALAAQNIPRPQQLQAAEAAAVSAKSALDAAEAQLKRLQGISRLVGPSQVADAQTAVEKAKADKQAADARLAELSELPAARKAAELQAKIRAAEADLRAAEVQLEMTRVRSPIAGRLGRLNVYLGQSLAVGTPVANVTDLRQIQLEASVPAKHIGQVRVGQSATISWGNDAAPQTLDGTVTFVSEELESGSGSFLVVIVAENPDERLKAGLHVHSRINVRHLDNVLAVPQTALIEEGDEPYLFVVEKGSEPAKKGEKNPLVARKVPVKVGARSGDLVQVEAEKLAEGVQVVTTGGYYLSDKAKVEIDTGDEKEADAKESEKKDPPSTDAKKDDSDKERPEKSVPDKSAPDKRAPDKKDKG